MTTPAPLEVHRPEGLGPTVLLMCAFLAVDYVAALLRLAGGTFAGLFTAEHLPRLLGGPIVVAAVLFVLWSYWKGENWARIFVLIWSVLLVGEESSAIMEQGGSLTAAMSHPVVFLKFVLALFLLYWLNTRAVRAFFKGAPTVVEHLQQSLTGRLCTAISKDPAAWRILFEHDGELTLYCPWRVVLDDNLVFASNSAPEPGEEEVQRLLQNLRVKAVRATPRTTDLFVAFEMGIELQTWSADPQTEQWRFFDPAITVVADAAEVRSKVIATSVAEEDSGASD